MGQGLGEGLRQGSLGEGLGQRWERAPGGEVHGCGLDEHGLECRLDCGLLHAQGCDPGDGLRGAQGSGPGQEWAEFAQG